MTAQPAWSQLSRLFDEVIALAPPDRERRLAQLRLDDADLAAQLEGLLALDAAPGGLLDRGLEGLGGAASAGPAAPEEDLSGQPVGPYRLTRRIGRGGMGTVYAAEREDGRFQQRVAVKVLASGGSPELLRRFDRERSILATLEHAHIARLLDAGSLGERPCLVMELVEGVDIVTHCDERRAGLRERLRFFGEVCAAVAFAHQHLIVHRDLKPSNVLVSGEHGVKLLDFGVAGLFDPESPAAAATTVARRAFTPAYAAPEQLLGQRVTTATDVYALGALLHELLVGVPPAPRLASGDDGRSPLAAALAAVPAPALEATAAARGLSARQLAHALRGDLAAIVAVALRPQPERRYRSVQELADDVGRHLAAKPVAARGDDRAYRLRSFARRHRAALAASALAVAALVAGMLLALTQAREARSEALRARALRRFLTNELKREVVDGSLEAGGPRLGAIFARGLPNVDEDFAGEPEVAAEIWSIAGETFRMMLDEPRAIAAFRGALERRRALYGDGDARVALASGDLATALIQHGDLAEAQPMLEAISRPGVLPGEQRRDMLLMLSRVHVLRSNLGAAERARREALALTLALPGRRPEERGEGLDRLASVLYLQGRMRASERTLGEALPLLRVEPHRLAVVWLRRAYALHHVGDLAAAAEAYAAARRIDGARANWVGARIDCGVGVLLAERGDAGAARDALAEAGALEVSDQQGSLEYREAGLPCAAVAAWLAGDLDGFRAGLAGSGKEPAPRSPQDTSLREMFVAELLLAKDQPAAALPLCQAVMRARDASPELLPWRRAEPRLLRAVALRRLGREAEAGAAIGRAAPVVAAAVPGHRFLRLAGAG